MMRIRNMRYFANMILSKEPFAKADISGSTVMPGLIGVVNFYPAHSGTMVVAEVYGLPQQVEGTQTTPPIGPFGFHIHEGSSCEVGSATEPFMSSGGHYNPTNKPHPDHAGDMPVLFSNNGYAFMAFYTDKFNPQQIVGRTVIIHMNPDDFRTQPAGNSGKKIACGVIIKM